MSADTEGTAWPAEEAQPVFSGMRAQSVLRSILHRPYLAKRFSGKSIAIHPAPMTNPCRIPPSSQQKTVLANR